MQELIDNEFWPTVNFDFRATSGPFFTGLPSSLYDEFKEALRHSTSARTSTGRVKDWLGVVKDSSRASSVLNDFNTFNEAVATLKSARATQSSLALGMMKDKIRTLRDRLIKQCFKDAKKHRASSSCYWVMVQLLTVDQIILGID